MSDLPLLLKQARTLLDASKPEGLTVADQAGLYAATRFIVQDIRDHIERDHGGDAYALGKARDFLWHMGAILGFDVANGHDVAQHRVWALGSLGTLEDVLDKPAAA